MKFDDHMLFLRTFNFRINFLLLSSWVSSLLSFLWWSSWLSSLLSSELSSWHTFVLTLIVLMLLGQPDFGAAIVIIGAAIGMIFLAGIPHRFFLPLVILFLSSFAVIATLQPYRVARLTAFRNPWEHQFDSGYQLTQALIAFGRGEWSGLGLGNSIQKLFFV